MLFSSAFINSVLQLVLLWSNRIKKLPSLYLFYLMVFTIHICKSYFLLDPFPRWVGSFEGSIGWFAADEKTKVNFKLTLSAD